MRPIWPTLRLDSVNHMLPSGPAVIWRGSLPAVGMRNTLKWPVGAAAATRTAPPGRRSPAGAYETRTSAIAKATSRSLTSFSTSTPCANAQRARVARKDPADDSGDPVRGAPHSIVPANRATRLTVAVRAFRARNWAVRGAHNVRDAIARDA